MADEQTKIDKEIDSRFQIAVWVLGCSGIGVVSLSVLTILSGWNSGSVEKVAQTVFSQVLPLLATWVGTVLAYYYSRENFESANRNVREMVNKITSMEKLQSIAASKVMIPVKDMACFRFSTQQPDESKVSLCKDLLALLESKNRNRLPVLDATEKPKYVIHRSLIDRFLANKLLGLTTPPAGITISSLLDQMTLKEMIDSSSEEVKKFLRVSFGTVKETDTLADAKQEMDREQGRLDVLVTKDGTANSPVVGWITNLIINDNAKV